MRRLQLSLSRSVRLPAAVPGGGPAAPEGGYRLHLFAQPVRWYPGT